jgi:hypothetical protein
LKKNEKKKFSKKILKAPILHNKQRAQKTIDIEKVFFNSQFKDMMKARNLFLQKKQK